MNLLLDGREDIKQRLQECADKYGLDYEYLCDWATRTLIDHGMLENVADGNGDIVEIDVSGEMVFSLTPAGHARAKELTES